MAARRRARRVLLRADPKAGLMSAMLRIGSWFRALALALACSAVCAQAQEPEVRDVSVRTVEDGLVLDADFAFELTPRLTDVLQNGVPLYFIVEFEMSRRRWYWFAEKSASQQLQLRLSYHALSRQYRLSTGLLQQNFAT